MGIFERPYHYVKNANRNTCFLGFILAQYSVCSQENEATEILMVFHKAKSGPHDVMLQSIYVIGNFGRGSVRWKSSANAMWQSPHNMMTSSKMTHFPRYWPSTRHRPLCGEFTGDRWIPRTKAGDAGLGDLRRHRAHWDVIVMLSNKKKGPGGGVTNKNNSIPRVIRCILQYLEHSTQL